MPVFTWALLSIDSVLELHEVYASVFFGYLLLSSGNFFLLCILVLPYSALNCCTITQIESYKKPWGYTMLVSKGLYLLLICLTSILSML
jgi:hypothetical protein